MKMQVKHHYEDTVLYPVSSHDQILISLSRLEAIRVMNDMGDLDPARIDDETVEFRERLKEITNPRRGLSTE